MKTKFLFPVLAIIFATGMSFTTAELGENLASDYVKLGPNQWMPIPEINCGTGGETCRVKLSDGSIHPVYDTQGSTTPKDSDNVDPFEL